MTVESALEKDICNEEDFVDFNIDISNSDLLQLCVLAHKQDITLNQLINNIMTDYVEKFTKNKMDTLENYNEFSNYPITNCTNEV